MALLEVTNLGIAFGGLQAVEKFALSIEKGHLYGLIGPNGAGKTTVFNMLTGVYQPCLLYTSKCVETCSENSRNCADHIAVNFVEIIYNR